MVYSLLDSSLCGTQMNVKVESNHILINYEKNGAKSSLQLNPNSRFKNSQFDIMFKVKDINELKENCEENRVYFEFVDREKLIEDIKNKLTVIAVNPEAKTIEITYENTNAKLSYDITKTLIEQYLFFQEEMNIKNSKKQ